MHQPLARLTQPLVRDRSASGERGPLRPASWDEALDRAAAGCGGGTAASKMGDGADQARTEKTVTPEQLLEGQWQGQMVLDAEAEKTLPAAQVDKLRAMTMGMEFQPGGKLILADVIARPHPELAALLPG